MRQRKITLGLCVAIGLVLLLTVPAQAKDPFTKLGRGLINLATGWVELPIRIAEGLEDEQGFWQPIAGFADGIGKAFQRTLYGAWDTLSFPFPPYNRPLLDPDVLTRDKNHPLIQ